MLRDLLKVLRADDGMETVSDTFCRMIEFSRNLTRAAGIVYFGAALDQRQRNVLLDEYEEIQEMERQIRRLVIARLSTPGHSADSPFGLLIMSLVKDVERIADHAKNLLDAADLREDRLPGDEITAGLQEVRGEVEAAFETAAEVFREGDRERAIVTATRLRAAADRCHVIISEVADSDYNTNQATVATLGARYYRRIASHLLNVVSGVILPLHDLDHFDENRVDLDENEGSESE